MSAAVVFDPYDYAIHEDPYPTYARLRDEAPVYRNDERDFWALSRHADVSAAFRDSTRFSNRHGVAIEPSAFGPEARRTTSFLAMDPPQHTQMRALVSRAFTPRRVGELEPRLRAIAVDHIEHALQSSSFDFVRDLAGKVPMDVISELVGVPVADRDDVRRLSDLVLHRDDGVFDIPHAGVEAALELVAYYVDLVADRRRTPGTDLTSGLLAAEIDGERLTDEDVISFLFLMVVAGNETTTKLLAHCWWWAWKFPEQRAIPFGDPSRIPEWVEETLRYDTSSQALARLTATDVELDGGVIPAGERVLLLVGSANRDPRAFADPDDYRIGRDTTHFASFGFGRHFCLGASLALLESRVVLEELVARVRDYDIDEAGSTRVHSLNVRGFATLPTTVTRR
jgi:hypothetical protein